MAEPKTIGTTHFWTKFSNFFSSWQWKRDSSSGIFSVIRNVWYGDSTVKIDCDDALSAYNDCPHLQIGIERKAEMFANGQWKCYKYDDAELKTPIESDEGLDLLKNPNPMQSGEEFLKDHIRYKSLFANEFIYQLSGSSLTLPRVLWFLPSELMETKFTGKVFSQFELKGIIEKFILTWGGKLVNYSPEEILYIASNFSLTEGKGKSAVGTSLKLPINNIVASLKTRNILTVNKGIIGFISNESKDAVGNVNMTDGQRQAIEKQFEGDTNLYSDSAKIKITGQATKWNNMSFPVRDLMLIEECEDDFGLILGSLGIDRDLFPSTKGATWENKKQAELITYKSTIQPEADSFAGRITQMLRGKERGVKYVLDYSWLPSMQKDRKEEEEADNIKAERLALLYGYNIIDRESFAKQMNVNLAAEIIQAGGDTLGKIPLALQQLALARERANTANDKALSKSLSDAMDKLTAQLVTTIIQS